MSNATCHISISLDGFVRRRYLAAGLLDELWLHIVPVVLGAGERLLVVR